MADDVLAAVRTAPGRTELQRLPLPDLPDDGALLRVEVAGICGTDVKMYAKPPFPDPVIMGHENVGTIAFAGRDFTRRHGLVDGDRVFVEHYVGADGRIASDAVTVYALAIAFGLLDATTEEVA